MLSTLYSLPWFDWKGRPLLSSAAHLIGGVLHFLLGYSLGGRLDGRGLVIAVFFALIFAAPDLGSRWLEAGWVLVFFVLAASAYAFFQVPYVAMPAEITTSYDERTRLMTWRVAILAFTIVYWLSEAIPIPATAVLAGLAAYRVAVSWTHSGAGWRMVYHQGTPVP